MQSDAGMGHTSPTIGAEAAVRKVPAELVAAWGRHDAEAYGALFTEGASYTTYIGTLYRGRRDIVESHRTLFAGFLKGTRLADEILDVRFHGPGVAVITGRGDTYKGKRPRKLGKVQTYTVVLEEDGQWRIAAFHNTRRKPLMEAVSYKVAPGLVPAAER
ncbi:MULTISPECIES: SgcJ/EcaC family oxidoreductase [unclassified Streptomyces]|uniref:SgcJ/EcaC family oxidoreductase n=1 Tax=unclassified Streptomyces TaxID=2593676 RepID=UPI00226FB88D|nr:MULTISPECIES: SgcJ/EcaC family oxidoreductase [unclassified Streptomyces]MCY0923044.1 SgcJ/EcaC family oxidoreductase [Streptomyces sp. H27-G5]MCY0956802.1 SgcJ/EcaC family oxidoreductase [Streptomyces sp. H27-H5]